MVKTPRTRHSKTVKEPVTIDLQPGEVSRMKAEAEKAQAAQPQQEAPRQSKEAEAAKPAEATGQSDKPQEEVTKAQGVKEAQKPRAEASAAASGPAFGRNEPPRKPATAEPAQQRAGGALLAGVAGGVLALLVAGGLFVAGLLPGGGAAQDDHAPAIAALESELEQLRGQIAETESGGVDGVLAGRVDQTEERLTALAAEFETLRGALAEGGEGPAAVDLGPLEARIDAVEAALAESGPTEGVSSATTLAELDERVGPLREDIAGLREEIAAGRENHAAAISRLDGLEETLATLSGRVDEQAQAPATAAIIAASALKAAIDRGAPFATELETWASLVPDAPQAEGLRVLAEQGVATRAQLAAEADAAANAMISAARPIDPEAGVVDRLWTSAMGLVQVRPVGMVEGEGVPETVARLDAAVAAGDYERAIAEYDTLPEAAKAAGAAFMERLRARHEADRLADDAVAAALRA